MLIDVVFYLQNEFEFESELTKSEHLTGETHEHEVVDTLQLDVKQRLVRNADWSLVGCRCRLLQQIATRVGSCSSERDVGDDDVRVGLRCASLLQHSAAAAVRLFATVVDDSDNWIEIADVLC